MKNFFKSLFGNKDISKSASAILYPDKIIIETNYQIKNSYIIRSADVSVLESSLSNEELGKTLITHIQNFKLIAKPSPDIREEWGKQYKNKTGLKTIKSQMNGSRMVLVSLQNGLLTFIPTENEGTTGTKKGYIHKPAEKIEQELTNDFALIGTRLREAFAACK